MAKCQTVTTKYYSGIILQTKKDKQTNARIFASKVSTRNGVLLLEEALSHTTSPTMEVIKSFKWQLMSLFPYMHCLL